MTTATSGRIASSSSNIAEEPNNTSYVDELVKNSLFLQDAQKQGFLPEDSSKLTTTVIVPSNEAYKQLLSLHENFGYIYNLHTAAFHQWIHMEHIMNQQEIYTQGRIVFGVYFADEQHCNLNSHPQVPSVSVYIGGVKCIAWNLQLPGILLHFLDGSLPDLRFVDSDRVQSFLPMVPSASNTTIHVDMELKQTEVTTMLEGPQTSLCSTLVTYCTVVDTDNYVCTSTKWKTLQTNRIPITFPNVGITSNVSVQFRLILDQDGHEAVKFDLPYYLTLYPNPCSLLPLYVTDLSVVPDTSICYVHGRNLDISCKVFFGDKEASLVSISNTCMKLVIPHGQGTVNVVLRKGNFVEKPMTYKYPDQDQKLMKLRNQLRNSHIEPCV